MNTTWALHVPTLTWRMLPTTGSFLPSASARFAGSLWTNSLGHEAVVLFSSRAQRCYHNKIGIANQNQLWCESPPPALFPAIHAGGPRLPLCVPPLPPPLPSGPECATYWILDLQTLHWDGYWVTDDLGQRIELDNHDCMVAVTDTYLVVSHGQRTASTPARDQTMVSDHKHTNRAHHQSTASTLTHTPHIPGH